MPEPVKPARQGRKGRRLDLVSGMLLGVAVGLAVVAAFVFLGSESTVDAPRISGVDTGKPATEPEPAPAPAPAPVPTPAPDPVRPVPIVRIVGGAPPPSGPATLRFTQGEEVRFRVLSDAPTTIEIPGYGFEQAVESGEVIAFEARHVGQYPMFVSGNDINLASLLVGAR
jgi:hypothetical protein